MRETMGARMLVTLVLVSGVICGTHGDSFSEKGAEGPNTNEAQAINFLRQYDTDAATMCNNFMEASWDFNTNVTSFNRRRMLSWQMEWSRFHRQKWEEATNFAWKNFSSAPVRRMFSFVTVLGRAALSEDKLKELTELTQEMKSSYSAAKICRYDPTRRRLDNGDYDYNADNDLDNEIGCTPTLSLEPHLVQLMATSRDPDELRYAWRAWRDAAGRPLRGKYARFVELSNEAARLNGYKDAGDFKRSDYETDDFEDIIDGLWVELRPLYEQLHAYVRRKLIEKYGDTIVPPTGPIPAHLLGNMWAQTWTHIMDLTVPYPNGLSVDVTDTLRRQGYSPFDIFRLSESFFVSLGLEPMPSAFWQKSLLFKPTDRDVICHASAWDFCNGIDYRIKQCTQITMEDLITAHHEMGHIQYDLQYRNQPFIFRDGANPAFHEAVGDVLALSAATPSHLQEINLLANVDDSFENDINFLFSMALDKIAFLPFGYLVDKWRWEVFSGEISESEYNSRWWDLRVNYQGVSAPLLRDEDDFDPGAKFHIPANVPYVRYFVSFIVQFQFHAELCKAAGHTGPLHHCNIYRSAEAGRLLRNVLSLGKSRPWPEALSVLTSGRTNSLEAGPILEYFQPLMAWLESQNKDEFIGWQENEAIVLGVVSSNASVVTGVILAFIAIVLLVALVIIAVRKLRSSGGSFTAPAPGT
ncbi:LOW QUALITY PROTEIN: angiotensin-converting enzyme-like [Penaeus chinensis]|uniref:LOW QUALITY PROTEIN: angiotensin-converting enzyme-like n=1 Tax=Penaeus chinensis TaxID=139456 RepID=UPI001FB839C9|nr:LOW QUALITY PROTEIN: angiotensin-converting enzyme-like [Penaeus chinensis]